LTGLIDAIALRIIPEGFRVRKHELSSTHVLFVASEDTLKPEWLAKGKEIMDSLSEGRKMLEPMMYIGGAYKHSHLIELVEDLGGYILQKNIMQSEVVLLMLVPINDLTIVEKKRKNFSGSLQERPLQAVK